MNSYVWESERNVQDVIDRLIALADKPRFLDLGLPIHDYKPFRYKQIGSNVYRFDLWYYFVHRQLGYNPAPFFGTISETKDGT